MSRLPAVSVIVATYNRAELLCATIDSILQQRFQDYELIVVDDGSTDNTRAALEVFLARAFDICISRIADRPQRVIWACAMRRDDGFRFKIPTIFVRRTTSNVFTAMPEIIASAAWCSRTAALSVDRNTSETRSSRREIAPSGGSRRTTRRCFRQEYCASSGGVDLQGGKRRRRRA